jgi:aminomethyltransferase
VSRRTSLYDLHRQAGARFTEFSGWEMPVQYAGILAEHETVRTSAGLFDVSHMGELEIHGPGALALCQRVATNDASKLAVGQAQYTVWCTDDGGTIDDTILYRLGDERYLFCVNAGNAETCRDWIREQQKGVPHAEVVDRCDELGLIALQGPRAVDVATRLGAADLLALPRFGCIETTIAGVPVIAARTGYTGEDGFEMFVEATRSAELWRALLGAGGKGLPIAPIGLGARDTLRLEAALPLYGHELSRDISPLEAGLGWAVKLEGKGDFIGSRALIAQKQRGLARRLVGIQLVEPGIARGDYPVKSGEHTVGIVTSGTKSPTLGKAVALALLASESVDAPLSVEIRGRAIKAERVRTPFYRREGAR